MSWSNRLPAAGNFATAVLNQTVHFVRVELALATYYTQLGFLSLLAAVLIKDERFNDMI